MTAANQISEAEQEAAWIAEQVAAMPTPSRRDIETWAALLDIRSLLNAGRAA